MDRYKGVIHFLELICKQQVKYSTSSMVVKVSVGACKNMNIHSYNLFGATLFFSDGS